MWIIDVLIIKCCLTFDNFLFILWYLLLWSIVIIYLCCHCCWCSILFNLEHDLFIFVTLVPVWSWKPCYESELSVILQWGIVPSMERRWIRSQDDAGGPMARNGGAPKMRTRTPSIVSGTCTVAVTVQESLWNHKLWDSHRLLWHHWLFLETVVRLEVSRTFH